MPRYRRYRHRKPMSAGQRAALDHIEQGRRLSVELGGLDAEVKAFFFSRPPDQLQRILDEYESEWGRAPRLYAEEAVPQWRAGATQMSGMVAERLFRFLPKFMTLEHKLDLARKLWEHTSPSSHRVFAVSPSVEPEDLRAMLVKHLEEVVVPHSWPADMVRRFDWLSADEVLVKQQLMNAIQSHEAGVVSAAITAHVVPIINQLHQSQEHSGFRARHDFSVGKHRVVVEFRKPVPVRKSQGCLIAFVMLGGLASLCGVWLLGVARV
jgi:hypothetical protein